MLHRTVGKLMNNELEMIWKEAVVTHFKVLSLIVLAHAVNRRVLTAAGPTIRGICGEKWHWDRFCPIASVSPATSHSTQAETYITISSQLT
jgi:hypothetical protein